MKSHKKILLGALLAVFALGLVFAPPKPVQAFSPDVVAINTVKFVWEKIGKVYDKISKNIVSTFVNNTLSMFMNKLAYDISTELATGGPGGTPRFNVKSEKALLKSAGEAAVGDLLGDLTELGFDELGINLCNPSLEVKLTISLSLIDEKYPPKPKCEWSQVANNWKQFDESLSNDLIKLQLDPRSGAASTRAFFQQFSLAQSDFGAYISINNEAFKREQEAKEAEKLKAEMCGEWLADTTTITEEKKSACELPAEEFKALIESSQRVSTEGIKDSKASVWNDIGAVMKNAGNLFINNFASKLMNQWIKKGMWSLGDLLGGDNSVDEIRNNLIEQLRGGADIRNPRSQNIFQDFQKIEIIKLDEYNPLEQFMVCPDVADFRSPDNCTLSPEMAQAIISHKTVQEAIDEGIINGNMVFISPDDDINNTSDDCYATKLCYSNLIKLRKANIIPVGWELAALNSEVSAPVTLQQAIDCFEDAPESNCIFSGVPHNPFYHLIDKNWVLKVPAASCEAYVNAATLESSASNNRQQYCADAKTCLREDDNGNCLDNQFGYCTKSENIWRFDGNVCEDGEIYSGCLTFDNDTYGTNSYIESTLDYCTADQVGCKRYSQTFKDGNWVLDDIDADNEDLFLNNESSSCPSSNAGCSEYIALAPDLGVNSIPNSDFSLDEDENGVPDNWTSAGLEYDGEKIANNENYNVGQKIILLPNTRYNLSFSSSQYINDSEDTAYVVIETCDNTDDCTGTSWSAAVADGGDCIIGYGSANDVALGFTPENDFSRGHCSFTTNEYVESAWLYPLSVGGDGAWFDDIKLEVVDRYSGSLSYSKYGDGGKIYINDDATMCTAKEVGCQGYRPDNGDPMIPAVIGQEDLCPAECVGYAGFAQQMDNFDIAEGTTLSSYYQFIPDTAQSCPAQAVGCEEFTNLDEVAAGGEGKEYYTYLRQCVLGDMGDVYYTWEGSDTIGYQIRTWSILASDDGAPCTNLSLIGLDGYDNGYTCIDGNPGHDVAICNPADNDPNCREFFDTSGNSYYRLQDRVIVADDACSDYRRSFNGQIYKALASMSSSCPAEQNNCRAYYGDAGNNIRLVSQDNFEEGAFYPWRSYPMPMPFTLDLSNESLNDQGHSLKFTVDPDRFRTIVRRDDEIEPNKEYQVSWWMKNNSHLDSVRVFVYGTNEGFTTKRYLHELTDSDLNNIPGGEWKRYTVSHFISEADLAGLGNFGVGFEVQGVADDVFFDNIIVKKIIDNVTVIRDSWQTPISCDSPYAGYHLGCRAYTDLNGASFNLKSFSSLCREEAIGCIPVINTNNSTYPYAETFHEGDYSEISVPADTLTYLVPDASKYCPQEFKGCTALGLPSQEAENVFTNVFKINNPDRYNNSLCYYDDLNCEAYSSDKGNYYFKDPGSQTCTYQEGVNIDGFLWDGWWQTNTLDGDTPVGCNDDGDGVVGSSAELELVAGSAAMCPESKNLCTAFRDPTDPVGCDVSIDDPNNENYCKTYYYYNDSNIDEQSCAGQVDRDEGCILFYETNNWNAEHTQVIYSYDSDLTYADNVAQNRPVSPVDCSRGLIPGCQEDANKLIKVNNDRQCSEWLACRSASAVLDGDTGQYKIICDSVGSCVKYDSTNNITNCKQWNNSENIAVLTTELYQSRATGENDYSPGDYHLAWSDDEYIGYSIPYLLPTEDLLVYNFDDAGEAEPRLVFDACRSEDVDCPLDGNNNPYFEACQGRDYESCSAVINGENFSGECLDDLCFLNPVVNSADNFTVETRGFAMPEAPFPAAISTGLNRLPEYSGANICYKPLDDDGKAIPGYENGCESSYVKVTYGQGLDVKYYPEGYDYDDAICTSGEHIGDPCTIGDNMDECDSSNGGICSSKSKVETFQNWPGICLEYDKVHRLVKDDGYSYYCNQWYPTNSISGTNSLYDYYQEAGYYNPDGQDALFCAVAAPYELNEDRFYCGYFNTDGMCNLLMLVPAGSRVNVDAIVSNGDLLRAGWLGAPGASGSFHYVTTDNNYNGYYDEVGRPFVYNGDGGSQQSRFMTFNFGVENSVQGSFIDDIEALFDASDAEGGLIKRFYFDDGVQSDGADNDSSFVNYVGADTDGNPIGTYTNSKAHCGDRGCDGDAKATCNSGDHQVYYRCHRGGNCGVRRWYTGYATCNPFDRDYYIYVEQNDNPWCLGDCNESDGKGVACLLDQDLYPLIEAHIAAGNSCSDWDDGDPDTDADEQDCRFVSCVRDAHNVSNWEELCDQYNEDDIYLSFFHVFGGANCSEEAFDDNGEQMISDRLASEAYTQRDEDGHITSVGCLNPEIPPNGTTQYTQCFAGDDFSEHSSGDFCEGLECYQQCDTITQLDSQGDRSDVRTDIWWRNEHHDPEGHFGDFNGWLSYYYNSPVYDRNNTVLYDTIVSENVSFTHYGAALGNVGGLVTTRVPLDRSYFSILHAATFFGLDWATAQDQLGYLFARVYKLDFNGSVYSQPGTSIDNIANNHLNINTEAGNDHPPKTLQVCGEGLCDPITEGITVNDNSSGEVLGYESLSVAVKFFYYAHPDHMPVTSLGIDWGDDGNHSLDGKYKNNLPVCDPEANMPAGNGLQGFGGEDRACQEGYKIFYHDYQYDPSPNVANCGTAENPATCYRISVRVVDNWGWETTEGYDGEIKIYRNEP